MDIKRKESKLVTSNQSSTIKPSKKRLVLGFRKHSSYKTYLSNMTNFLFKTKKRKLIFSLLFIFLIIAPLSFYLWNKSAQADWWNSDWNYRRSITINSAQIPADLTNYPMLVSFTDSNLINKTQTDGGDIIFIEENGNRLDHEIEKFDNTTGELVAWVKIPQLDGDNDSIIYMYYGNQTVDNQQRVEDVWDENYLSVQHFNESSATLSSDSSRNNKNGTKSGFDGDELTSGGKVGPAYNLDGTNDYIFIPDMRASDYDEITMSVWFKSDVNNNSEEMLNWGQSHPAGGTNWAAMFHRADTDQYVWYVPNTGWADTETENMNWNYATMKLNSANQWEFGFNGNSIGTYNDIANHQHRDVSNFVVAGNGYWGYLDGLIDEVRISKVPRSNNWITTEYNNQNSPSTFISLGQEEHGSSPALYLPFDEGFGTTAHDETSNHNDGNIVGATWKDESNCKSGKCLEFDGTGDYVEINDNKSLDLSEEVTLEAWVKPQSTTPNNQTIISKVETPTDPTKIFRSVGPSATGALATGTATNHLTIVGDRAVFAEATPSQVGVGDAIQYDDDDDGDIDANDSIVFILSRISNTQYSISNASGGVPTPINADTNWSLFRAYTSLANAERGVENTGIDSDLRNFDDWTAGGDATTDDVGKDLVTANQQWNITCYANGTTADTSGVDVNGWTTNTGSSIRIYTPVNADEVGVSQRHGGKWDDNFYRLEITGSSNMNVRTVDVWIDGLQLKQSASSGSGNSVLHMYSVQKSIKFSNNIFKGVYTGTVSMAKALDFETGYSNSNLYFWNNIFYDFVSPGGNDRVFCLCGSAGNVYLYSNTIVNSTMAFNDSSGINSYVKNNIVQAITDGYVGTFGASSDYNISNLATDAPGANSKNSTTVSFISTTSGSEDFHLAPTDTAAKNSGADLSGDNVFPIATDIDGNRRDPSSKVGMTDTSVADKWDVGADEARATQIYRSVAPNKTDALETGDGNAMTITGDPANGSGAGTATFQRALADNVGVGDVIQYDDDNDSDIDANDSLVFISGRVSSYEFLVTTVSGGTPTQVINDNDWSLFRAYTSLANAENGDENTGIDSDLRNFDSWSGGKDLVTSKEQWNIACYANGTTADTTAVVVDGWTTDVQSFVKIYTPVNETEVGTSQRHDGKWDTTKYNLALNLGSTANARILSGLNPYIKLQGLQISHQGTGDDQSAIYSEPGYLLQGIEVGFCIIKHVGTIGDYTGIYGVSGLYSDGMRIYNTLIYDYLNSNDGDNAAGIFDINTENTYVSNVTIVGCSAGLRGYDGTIAAKNVLVSGHSAASQAFSGTFDVASDYNASDDNSAPGSNSRHGQIFSFKDSTNDDFHLSSTDTSARNFGINLSTDANIPINSDIDGEVRSTQSSFDIGADEAVATKIYRSVGPNNTSALATDDGHENTVEFTDGQAVFAEAMPSRVGVGDAVLIDTNSDNAITSADTLLFIHSRTSSTVYTLRTHTGAVPSNISSNDTYQIFRAYTSLANAESGTKNTSIPITFNGGNRDLVTNNEEWNIACYGDGADTTTLTVDGWITGGENYINIYTPVGVNEVGISQRHNGKWDDTKYSLMPTNNSNSLIIQDDFVRLEGLQIKSTSYNATNRIGIYANNIEGVYIGGNIIKEGNIAQSGRIGISIYIKSSAAFSNYVYNNIVYNFTENNIRTNGSCLIARQYIINNTCINAGGYSYDNFSGTTAILKNNLNYGTFSDYCPTGVNALSTNNAYVVTSPAGASNSINISAYPADSIFVDPDNEDFRLAMTGTAVKGAGLNLSNDANLPVTHDIEGEKRPSLRQGSSVAMPSLVTGYGLPFTSYDVGADQISNITHDNYSLNLKTNYPQANFSTGNNDQDNFSSGDINLEANTWSHIAYKRSNDIEELYINGSKKDSSTISNFLKTNNGKLYLGSDNASSKNSFKGLLDEIKIYPYARTESEIKKDKVAGSSGRAASRAQEGISVSIGDKSSNLSDGLVGYWKMDETSWTGAVNEVKDASGNNNHGMATGGVTTNGGKFSSGGDFDGTDDYVTVADSDSISITNAYTYAAWVRFDDVLTGLDTLVSKQNSNGYAGGGREWSIGRPSAGGAVVDGKVQIGITHNQAGYHTEWDYPYQQWFHLTVSWDGSTARIYSNGQLIDEFAIIGSLDTEAFPLLFGDGSNTYDWDGIFSGAQDEVRLYKRALSGNEVQQLYNYAPGPVIHLKMDEKSGTTAFDSSGFGNDGNLMGDAIWDIGKVGGAVRFDGSADYIDTKDIEFGGVSPITVCSWVKSDNLSGAHTIISQSSEIVLRTNGSNLEWILNSFSTNDRVSVASGIQVGKWHYFCGTYSSGGDMIVYLDGNLIGRVTPTGSYANFGNAFLVGRLNADTEDWAGIIDDVKIYNYARTQEQILEDMSSQALSASGGGALKSPILDLNFNEGQGATVNDASGNGNNGTLNAGSAGKLTTTAMWTKAGKESGAINFDGTDDYVSLGNESFFDFKETDAFSISTWIKRSTDDTEDAIVEKVNPTGGIWNGYAMWLPAQGVCSNCVQVDITQNASTSVLMFRSSNDVINIGQWQNVIMTYDGSMDISGLKVYVDGKSIPASVSADTLSGSILNNNNLLIGTDRFDISSGQFDGSIDEVKIYNYALGEDEIKTLHNGSSAMKMGDDETRSNFGMDVTGGSKEYCVPGDDALCNKPVLELSLNEKSGTTAKDTSGNGNNGTVSGATWDRGKINGGLNFNGGTSNASGTFSGVSNFPFTMSVWTMATSGDNGSFRPAVNIGVDSDEYFGIGWGGTNGEPVMAARNTSFTDYVGSAQGTNKWTHLVGVFNSSTSRDLYIDGKYFGRQTTSVNFPTGSNIYQINRTLASGQYGFMKVDDVKIYNYARTPAQIAWDYNQGLPINNWTLNEGTSTTAHDLGEGKNHGTITGATWKDESECKNGKCLYFNGLDQTRVAADTQDNMTNFTACTWMKANALINSGSDPWMSIFNKGWSLRLYNNGRLRFENPTSGTYPYLVTQDALNANQWYRACGVYYGIGTTPKIYLNGVEQSASASDPGDGTHNNDSSSGLEVGSDTGGWADNFYGYIDDPKIYNYTLSPLQVQLDYNNSSAVNFK